MQKIKKIEKIKKTSTDQSQKVIRQIIQQDRSKNKMNRELIACDCMSKLTGKNITILDGIAKLFEGPNDVDTTSADASAEMMTKATVDMREHTTTHVT